MLWASLLAPFHILAYGPPVLGSQLGSYELGGAVEGPGAGAPYKDAGGSAGAIDIIGMGIPKDCVLFNYIKVILIMFSMNKLLSIHLKNWINLYLPDLAHNW